MTHAGQVCMSTERVIVQKAVSDALVNKVSALCRSLKAGDCRTDPSAKLPCVMNEVFAENILGMVREAKDGRRRARSRGPHEGWPSDPAACFKGR